MIDASDISVSALTYRHHLCQSYNTVRVNYEIETNGIWSWACRKCLRYQDATADNVEDDFLHDT